MKALECEERVTDSQEEFRVPTQEDYEYHKEKMVEYSSWVSMSRKRQEELLDSLYEERETCKCYIANYERHKEEARKYEILMKIQEGKT